MKIMLPGPMAGPGPYGTMEGWGPNHVREIDDNDPRQVAWAKGWLTMGAVQVPDDTPAQPVEIQRTTAPVPVTPAPAPAPPTPTRTRKGA